MPAFVDTNILLYALVAEEHESDKRDIARQILSREDLVLSYQVLVEFCYQATRPSRTGALTPERATRYVRAFSRFPIVTGRQDLVFAGLELRRLTNYSIWDCMIIAAAREAGCDTLLSEDMADGHAIAGLSIVNPFG